MANIENMFGSFYESMNRSSTHTTKAGSASHQVMDSAPLNESLQSLPSGPQEEYLLQTQIRPIFGKEGLNTSPIGTHPDFLALEGSNNTQKHYTCTLFVDIKGSTRLSLLYDLEFIFKFKNAVIQTCVEVVRSFDGHVHRLMGDAVMAFFGGSSTEKEDAIADAINCSVTLRAILEQSIKPWMINSGLDAKDFGFRIGCDFGNDDDVLWGSFGYQGVGEVSATGLSVDMASKLQSLAGKNQTMLGQGLLEFVDWPEKYSKIKDREKDGGGSEYLPVVTPNITDKSGNPLNYKMRSLDFSKCLKFSALPLQFRERIAGVAVKNNPNIDFKCFIITSGSKKEYISASYFLGPNLDIVFEVKAITASRLSFPLRVVFKKTNHGLATPKEERDIEQEPVTKWLIKKAANSFNSSMVPRATAELKEATLYRGLHTMKCEVFDNNNHLIFRDWIGVMIK